jgi:hypothetical protein
VAPWKTTLLLGKPTVMVTPLAGLVEFTVSTYFVVDVVLVPLPQAVTNRLNPLPIQIAACQPTRFMARPPHPLKMPAFAE